MAVTIRTKRLILRPWRLEDIEPFAALNADPKVMEYFASIRNYEETVAEYLRIQTEFEKHGWGLWAVELAQKHTFIGYIGLHHVPSLMPFAPAIEVGWRLAYMHWGSGYATEGAKAALDYGFNTLHLQEIVAFTTEHNKRSRHVMEKLGMHHNPLDDFEHPLLPIGHSMQHHVLYRIQTSSL